MKPPALTGDILAGVFISLALLGLIIGPVILSYSFAKWLSQPTTQAKLAKWAESLPRGEATPQHNLGVGLLLMYLLFGDWS